jgi:hypothetical protein
MNEINEEQRTFDRRRFLRGAATVAWATPLILTVSASSAAAVTVPCTPNGVACGDIPTTCCAGNCCCTSQDFPAGVCAPILAGNTCGVAATPAEGTCM